MKDLQFIAWYPDRAIAGAADLPAPLRGLYFVALTWQARKGSIPGPEPVANFCGDTVENAQAVLDAKFTFDKTAGGWVNARMRHEREHALKTLENKREGARKAREVKAAKQKTGGDAASQPRDSIWVLTQKIRNGEEHLRTLRATIENNRGDTGAIRQEARDLRNKLLGWRRVLTNS